MTSTPDPSLEGKVRDTKHRELNVRRHKDGRFGLYLGDYLLWSADTEVAIDLPFRMLLPHIKWNTTKEYFMSVSDDSFELWWVSNPSNMLNLTPEQAERIKMTAEKAWKSSRHMRMLAPNPPFTAEDVRSLIRLAVISTGSGDGSNEREELDYEWLARAINDRIEGIAR